jgi:peptidoglycan/xylan/chitin deacetylase (PgdA/CDA1 family)
MRAGGKAGESGVSLTVGRAAERLVRSWRAWTAPGAVILLYHRVAETPSPWYQLSVTPARFAEHLEVLRRAAYPMSLLAMVSGLQQGRLPRRAVAVTFDDGYADNLLAAKPLLEQQAVPATVFVTVGLVGSSEGPWWDELEQHVFAARLLPRHVRVVSDGQAHDVNLVARDGDRTNGAPGRLIAALDRIMRRASLEERRAIFAQLRAQVPIDAEPRADRMLTARELVRLADGDLVEVGAHTMTHPVLSGLSVAALRAEVGGSKRALEAMLGRPVTAFSYPFGTAEDFDANSAAVVREAGFACACAVAPRAVRPGADVYRLPRFAVRDWDGETFGRRLRAWWGY